MARRKNSAEAFEIFRRIAQKEAEARAPQRDGSQANRSGKRRRAVHRTEPKTEEKEQLAQPSVPPSRPSRRGTLRRGGVDRGPLLADRRGRSSEPAKEESIPENSLRRRVRPRALRRPVSPPQSSESSTSADGDVSVVGSSWLARGLRTRPRVRKEAVPVDTTAWKREPVRPLELPVAHSSATGSGEASEAVSPDAGGTDADSPLLIELIEAREPPPGRNRLENDESFADPVPVPGEGDFEVEQEGAEAEIVGTGGGGHPVGGSGGKPDGGGEREDPGRAGRDPSPPNDSSLSDLGPYEYPEEGTEGIDLRDAFQRWTVRAFLLAKKSVVWVLSDGANHWLGRSVEMRRSTLILGTLALVTVLALIGIYLKKPAPADKFFDRMYGSPAFSSVGPGSGPHRLPEPGAPRPVFHQPGDAGPSPAPKRPPEFRAIVNTEPQGTVSADPDGTTVETSGVWVRARAEMDKDECVKLVGFLETKLLPFVVGGADKIGGKRVATELYKDGKSRPRWKVYVGPFATRPDADKACEQLKAETKRSPFIFQGNELYFDSAYVAEGPNSSR